MQLDKKILSFILIQIDLTLLLNISSQTIFVRMKMEPCILIAIQHFRHLFREWNPGNLLSPIQLVYPT